MQTLPIQGSGYQIKTARIREVKSLTATEKLFEMVLAVDEPFHFAEGQFVEVSLFGAGEAPISICSSPLRAESFDLCVRAAGRLTGALHRLGVGDEVGIRGPFGVGFPLEDLKGRDVLLIAGGLGLAPLRSLIHSLIMQRADFGKLDILLGCRDPQSMLFCDELICWEERADINFCCSVDRAAPDWAGNVGVITALIPGVTLDPLQTMAVVCGPPVMYRYVIDELLSKGIPDTQIYLSLERHMKCGLGKCGHCQIDGVYCCQDGPVFSYDRVRQIRGAI